MYSFEIEIQKNSQWDFLKKTALLKSSMYELFNKYSVVFVRLTPSLPQWGMHPKGNPLDPLIV